jgi:predicted hydrocarbon binding protein
MKGIITNILGEFVESTYGIVEWNEVLNDAGVSGDYNSYDIYPDGELLGLIAIVSKRNEIPANVLVHKFGSFMYSSFAERYPELIDKYVNVLELLESIDSVIHVEVNKLHPGAITPVFEHEYLNDRQLKLKYYSKRKLCDLALGLIDGAALYLKQPCDVVHSRCMHKDGGDHCEFLVTVNA